MTDHEIDKLYEQIVGPGPTSFHPNNRLTEKRTDIGVPKFNKPIVDEKEKEAKETDERPALYPNADTILPNHMSFKYYEPSKDLGPKHMPDAVANPGSWKFYEVNLDAIKEEVATNVYFGGAASMTKDEFSDREDFLEVLRTYLDRKNNKKPEAGQYDAKRPEKHLADIDFDKMQSRAQYYDEDFDDELDKEGDVLYLDPRQPEKHVPGFELSKQEGRGEDNTEFEEQKEEMILNPNPDAVKKKQGLGGAIAMDKQVGRPVEVDHDEEVYVVNDPTPAVLNDPSLARTNKGIPWDKFPERFEYEPEKDEQFHQDELILPAEVKPLPKAKVFANMDKAQDRFKPSEPKENLDLQEVAERGEFVGSDAVDVLKAWKTTRPKEPVADFKLYRSTAPFRVDNPKESKTGGDEDED